MAFVLVAVVRNFYWGFCCPLISFSVSKIKFFSRVEGLFLYIIHIIIHTIKDPVGIPKYGTCRISGGSRLKRKVPDYVFAVEIIHHWIHERKTCLIYWCTGMYVCCWKTRCSVIISIRIHLGCGLWCTVVFICEIDLDLALFLFDLLYVKLFCLLMHTIQDKVGITNCGTLGISSIPFVSFFLQFSVVVFITSVSTLSPINLGVMFSFSFSSLCNIYLSVSGCGIFPVR